MNQQLFRKTIKNIEKLDKWDANEIEQTIKKFLKDEELNFKDIVYL